VSATLASDYLFQVRGDRRKLKNKQAEAFHHTTYQLLFAANRAKHNIQTAVAFLATRVLAPDKDDWGKMKKVLKYLHGMQYSKLKLNVDKLSSKIHWYNGGLHQIHDDC
jgi:hypothetical protein